MVELYIFCLVFPFGGVAADPHGCQTSAVPLSTPSCLCKFMFVRPILFLDTKGKPVSSPTINSIPILQQQFAPPQKKEPHRQQESPLRFYGNDKKCWHCLDLDFFPSSATFPLPCFSSWHLSSTCILYIYFCCLLSVSTYRLGTYNLHKDIYASSFLCHLAHDFYQVPHVYVWWCLDHIKKNRVHHSLKLLLKQILLSSFIWWD